jgi:hypothetical protein
LSNCVTTNIFGIVTTAVAGVGYDIADFARRQSSPRSAS